MHTSNIRAVNPRGFGFIEGQDGHHVFFHASVVEGVYFDALQQGEPVEYEAHESPKGLVASVVRPVMPSVGRVDRTCFDMPECD